MWSKISGYFVGILGAASLLLYGLLQRSDKKLAQRDHKAEKAVRKAHESADEALARGMQNEDKPIIRNGVDISDRMH